MFDPARFNAHWFVLSKTLRNWAKHNARRRPILVLSLRELKQRYLYLVALSFMRSGFFVLLDTEISRQCYWDTDPYARYVFDDPRLKVVGGLPRDRSRAVLCVDHDGVDPEGWSKVIRISYDIREGLSLAGSIVAPYWMHPNAYRTSLADSLENWRDVPKSVKILFAGNLARDRYTYKGPLNRDRLNRIEILQRVLARFPDRTLLIRDPDELKALLEKGHRHGIVVFDATDARLGREEWFPVLSRCEYFLALPGVLMPMSHNMIEAMALGCVPICNYPDWFSPRLAHGKNCLAFGNDASLGQAVESALNAAPEQTARLRAGVLDYFGTRLQPRAFLDPVFESRHRMVTVYVNAEEISEKAAFSSGSAA